MLLVGVLGDERTTHLVECIMGEPLDMEAVEDQLTCGAFALTGAMYACEMSIVTMRSCAQRSFPSSAKEASRVALSSPDDLAGLVIGDGRHVLGACGSSARQRHIRPHRRSCSRRTRHPQPEQRAIRVVGDVDDEAIAFEFAA